MKYDPWSGYDLTEDQRRTLGRLIMARRYASNLSRLALARLTGLSDATIKFAETGKQVPSYRTMTLLLEVPQLGLHPQDIPGWPHMPQTSRTKTAPTLIMCIARSLMGLIRKGCGQ